MASDYLEINRILYGNAVQSAASPYGNVQRQDVVEVNGQTRKRGQNKDQATKQNNDTVEISDEALEKAGMKTSGDTGGEKNNAQGLTEEEQAQVDELKKADQEVRAHEQAHMAAGGNLVTRGASYTYKTGPDGQRYAVAGEVQIDSSPEKDPEDTMRKMERVRQAAMAPANPSPQDQRVAAEASAAASKAAAEMLQQQSEKMKSSGENGSAGLQNSGGNEGVQSQTPSTGTSISDTGMQLSDRQRANTARQAYAGSSSWQTPATSTGMVMFA